jgi:hypothetical protein
MITMVVAAFVIWLPTFGGITATIEATDGVKACHRAFKVLTSQMDGASLAYKVIRPCPPDPDVPEGSYYAPENTDAP